MDKEAILMELQHIVDSFDADDSLDWAYDTVEGLESLILRARDD